MSRVELANCAKDMLRAMDAQQLAEHGEAVRGSLVELKEREKERTVTILKEQLKNVKPLTKANWEQFSVVFLTRLRVLRCHDVLDLKYV